MPLYKYMYSGKYEDYISTWGNREECEEYEKILDSWLSQFNDDEQFLMLQLLEHFKMFRGHLLDLKIKELFDLFKNQYPNWESNTIFSEIKKDKEEVGNSDIFFSCFWKTNGVRGWSKRIVTEEYFKSCQFNHFVFIDDYAGSGESVITFLEHILDKFPESKTKKITILLLACSKSAKIAIENCKINTGLDLDLIYLELQGKALKVDELFSGEELNSILPQYETICAQKELNYPKGFRGVEALIAFDYGTPNNTLGVCWETHEYGNRFHGFWPRRENEIPTIDSMKRDKKLRSLQASKKIFKNSAEDIIDYFFMGCCIASKKKFNMARIIKQFGLSKDQFYIKLEYCLDNGYMQLIDGAYLATPKFLENVKSSYREFFKKIVDGYFSEDITLSEFQVEYKNYICKEF